MRQGSKTNYHSNNKLNFVKHLETSKNQSDVKHSRLVGLEFDRTQTENIEGQQHKHQVKNNQLKKWWHQCSHLDVKVMQIIQAAPQAHITATTLGLHGFFLPRIKPKRAFMPHIALLKF